MPREDQGRPERRGDGPRGPRDSSASARKSGPRRDSAPSGERSDRTGKPTGGGYQGRPENAQAVATRVDRRTHALATGPTAP
jgi:hypothetical protein